MHFIDENFWIAISFVIFVYLAYRPVKKAIFSSLETKIAEIRETLSATEKLKAEAQSLLDRVRQETNELEDKKAQMIADADATINKVTKQRSKEIDLLLTRMQDSVLETIQNKQKIAAATLRDEFMANVLATVEAYLQDTQNNHVSDSEIIDRLIKQDFLTPKS